jgi:hypothetical protein
MTNFPPRWLRFWGNYKRLQKEDRLNRNLGRVGVSKEGRKEEGELSRRCRRSRHKPVQLGEGKRTEKAKAKARREKEEDRGGGEWKMYAGGPARSSVCLCASLGCRTPRPFRRRQTSQPTCLPVRPSVRLFVCLSFQPRGRASPLPQFSECQSAVVLVVFVLHQQRKRKSNETRRR